MGNLVNWMVGNLVLGDTYTGSPYNGELICELKGTFTKEARAKMCTLDDVLNEVDQKLNDNNGNDGNDNKYQATLLAFRKVFGGPHIKQAIFNPPATVILWDDGTKSVVKCQNGEPFDAEKGFVMAYLKKLLGNDNTFNKEITRWVDYEEPVAKECVDKHCDTNEPLTTEELMKMDGKRVWLSSMMDGLENFTDEYCGWHTVNVSTGRLDECDSDTWYLFSSNGTPHGFRAYRRPPKQAEEN